jgi:hypothetical protein
MKKTNVIFLVVRIVNDIELQKSIKSTLNNTSKS